MGYSLEELQDIINKEKNQEPEKKIYKLKENGVARRFINKSGMKPGLQKVPTYVIYYIFRKWANEFDRTQIGKTEFFRTFNRYFESKRSGHQRYYLINEDYVISDETIEAAKRHGKKK